MCCSDSVNHMFGGASYFSDCLIAISITLDLLTNMFGGIQVYIFVYYISCNVWLCKFTYHVKTKK